MIKEISQWLMQWFISLGLSFEAALAATIVVFIIGILALIAIADKILKTKLCKPIRQRICKIFREDDSYSPDTEG